MLLGNEKETFQVHSIIRYILLNVIENSIENFVFFM